MVQSLAMLLILLASAGCSASDNATQTPTPSPVQSPTGRPLERATVFNKTLHFPASADGPDINETFAVAPGFRTLWINVTYLQRIELAPAGTASRIWTNSSAGVVNLEQSFTQNLCDMPRLPPRVWNDTVSPPVVLRNWTIQSVGICIIDVEFNMEGLRESSS